MDNAEQGSAGLRDYLAVLRVRKWTIILCTVLVTGAAIAFSMAQTPQYTAESRVLVKPTANEATTFNPLLPVDIQTQVELIASESVAAVVAESLELDEPIDSILEGLSVSPQGQTQVVRIEYTSPDRERASQMAQAFAQSYIDFRRQQALQDVLAEEEAVQERIQAATTQLGDLTEDLSAARAGGDEALTSSLETQRTVLISRLGVLQQELDDVRADRSQATEAGQIIEPAQLPESPSSPNHGLNAAVALFLGIGLGVGMAFLRERLDDRFKDRSDVEKLLGAPVLATVPRYGAPKKGESALVSVSQGNPGAVESYRSLRTNLQFITSQRNIKSLLITSPSEHEGKSATTANLGVLLAQAGRRVILMSSDLRRPTLGSYFGLAEGHDDEPGLSSWLASDVDEAWDVIRDPGIPNLRVIPSGPIPPNPAELLTSRRTETLVRLLESNCDLVLCDSPPVLAVADTAELASVVGGSVLVVNIQSTHKSATVHARQELERVGGKLIGAVLNGYDPSTSAYYHSSYSSYTAAPGRADTGNGKPRRAEDRPKRRFLSRR